MPGGRKPAGQHGGYRAPAAPAPVSGPGAMSARTDAGPSQPVRPIPSSGPGGTIGDRAASVAQQEGAPLAAPADPSGAAGGAATTGGYSVPDIWGSPSARPGEPVTAGAQLGPGAGAPSEAQTAADLLRGVLTTPAGALASSAITALLEQLGG